MDVYTMGDVIRRVRKKRKLTQKQLSELTGISISQISGVELGYTQFSLENAVKVALCLKIDMNELVGIEKPEQPAGPAIDCTGLSKRQIAALETLVEELRGKGNA